MKTRYLVGGVLVIGIAAGVWLSDFLKGIGLGPGQGGVPGSGTTVTSVGSGAAVDLGVSHETPVPETEGSTRKGPQPPRVIIDDRTYYLRDDLADRPAPLERVVATIQAFPGDDDGIRVRIYRTETARVTAELELKEALAKVGVKESAMMISPDETRLRTPAEL